MSVAANADIDIASPRPMAGPSPRFHRLTVAEVRREIGDAVSVAFDVPPHLAEAYRFMPGQYLTLRATVDGEDLRRSYSICSGPGEGELRVAVKRVADGQFSRWINEHLEPGSEIDVMTPTGRFGLGQSTGDGRIHAGFAAGSGITPVISILRAVLAGEPNSRFFLFYGNRSTQDMLFRTELEELKDRFLDRLAVFHVLSQEEQDLPILNGRLDGAKVRILLRSVLPAEAIDHAFVCGPAGMIEELEETLKELGLPAANIHVERFVSAHGGRPQAKPKVAPTAAAAHIASLILDGKRRDVPVAEGEAILDAALRAGMDLPFACKGGMCSTCRAKLQDGEVDMDVNYSLEPWEIEAGFVLTCQSHPRTSRVTLDFDHV